MGWVDLIWTLFVLFGCTAGLYCCVLCCWVGVLFVLFFGVGWVLFCVFVVYVLVRNCAFILVWFCGFVGPVAFSGLVLVVFDLVVLLGLCLVVWRF